MNCARSAPLDRGHFLLEKCVLSSPNAKFSPLRGPESALRAARYAGRATRAGVLRTAREAGGRTCGPILLMKPSSLVSRTRSLMSRVSSVCVGLVVGVGCSQTFPKHAAVGASASKSMPASKGVDRAPAKVPNRGRRRWKQQLPCQARTSRAGPGSVATCCSRRLSPTQRRQRAAPGGDEQKE